MNDVFFFNFPGIYNIYQLKGRRWRKEVFTIVVFFFSVGFPVRKCVDEFLCSKVGANICIFSFCKGKLRRENELIFLLG